MHVGRGREESPDVIRGPGMYRSSTAGVADDIEEEWLRLEAQVFHRQRKAMKGRGAQCWDPPAQVIL